MRWTKEKPTAPGWYWYRGPFDSPWMPDGIEDADAVVLYVEKKDEGLVGWAPFVEVWDSLDNFPGEWAGPITPP